MMNEPKNQENAGPVPPSEATGDGRDAQQDRSPARSKDRQRNEKDEQGRTDDRTDEIGGAEADEDTYD